MDFEEAKWAGYVSAATRKAKALEQINELRKQGKSINPVTIAGRKIAKTFWGMAWCKNLESYSDNESHLPLGRSYLHNGAVIDLQVRKGKIYAKVLGSTLYNVKIEIAEMAPSKWNQLVKACLQNIDSDPELLQGKFSKSLMEILTEKEKGLFPESNEIHFSCSCPDWTDMCKHVAAALYGVGACLDQKPEWLFTLRHVDPSDLLAKPATSNNPTKI